MSALDILEGLNGIDYHFLDPLQRILLITDGTLTEILEASLLERIKLVKLSQQIVADTPLRLSSASNSKDGFMERKILLQGEASGKNYAYAESFIALDHLNPQFRDELLHSDTPLGRLWLDHRLETFKQMQDIKCQPANDLASYFDCPKTLPLLVRTYYVIAAKHPVMIITEYFPSRYS